MGFLDRKSRVIDVVLTGRGRELLAQGELDFSYYAFFDDGLDYDPWTPSGSVSNDDQRDELISSQPMLEAPVVQDRRSSIIPLEPTSFLFKAAPDYGALPRLLSPFPTGSNVVLRCDQVSSGSFFIRTGTSVAAIDLELSAEAGTADGFSIHVYSSGSNGLSEVRQKFDLKGRRALDPFIAFTTDSEVASDMEKDPFNRRRGRR